MKFSILLFALTFPFFTYSQTVVIGVKTKNAIYVGADSRTTKYIRDPLTGKSFTDTAIMCKLFSNDKFGFAIMGVGLEVAHN